MFAYTYSRFIHGMVHKKALNDIVMNTVDSEIYART